MMMLPNPASLVSFDGGHRSYGNADINSYINSYLNASGKVELTTLIRHIERFLKSGLPISNPDVPYTTGKKNKKNIGNCKAL